MTSPVSSRAVAQTSADMRRITDELAKLQGQIASSKKANDLQGYGSLSSQLLSAQSLKAKSDARSSVIGQLESRLSVQGAALGQVS